MAALEAGQDAGRETPRVTRDKTSSRPRQILWLVVAEDQLPGHVRKQADEHFLGRFEFLSLKWGHLDSHAQSLVLVIDTAYMDQEVSNLL